MQRGQHLRFSLRRPSRLGLLGLLAVVLAVAAVPIAWAAHTFTDVDDSHQFHSEISAIAGAGITRGCNPAGTAYCPDELVRRDAMAAFMHRGFSRVTYRPLSQASLPANWASSITPGLPAGAAGAANFLKVDASVTVNVDTASGCPCKVQVSLTLDGDPIANEESLATVSGSGQSVAIPITWAGRVTTPGARTVNVDVRPVGEGSIVTGMAFGSVTLTTFPFGGTGDNTLGGG